MALVHFDRVTGQADDSLDITLGRIVGKPENHYVAPIDLWRPAIIVVIDQLIDEDALAVMQVRQHRRALDLDRLNMKTIASASRINAKVRSRTSKRDSCHKCFRAASRGRCTSMSPSSSASTVPNGGGWLNRFPNIGFVLENPGYASLPACHRHQSVFDRSRHAGNDAYLRDHFHRIEVIRRLLALSNDLHSYQSLTVIIAAFYHPRHAVQRRILLPNRQLSIDTIGGQVRD